MNDMRAPLEPPNESDSLSPGEDRPRPFRRHAKPGQRSNLTRGIHLALLLLVLNQLVSSQGMHFPRSGQPASWLFLLHEYAGLVTIPVLTAFWVWTVIRRGETRLSRLVPWFSVQGMQAVATDAAAQAGRLLSARAPDDRDGALASAIHGIGLLVMTMMAVTGGIYFAAAGSALAHSVLGMHKLLANLAWAYLFVHAGMATLHQWLGSDIFARIFWLPRGRTATLGRDAR